MKLCVLDFETANSHPASACSLGVLVIEDGVILHEWVSLIQPHPAYDNFDPFNIQIHHITASMVKDAPSFAQIYPILLDFFEESILMAHFAPFDMKVLSELIHVYGLQLPKNHYIDSVEIARRAFPSLPNHKLNTVCAHLAIELNHHEALSDARGSALIALHTMSQLEEFDLMTWIKKIGVKIYTLG